MSTVLISCAEASGDLLASGVARTLKERDPSVRIVGIAGSRCREQGVKTRWDVSELSVMGIAEVLPKLRRIFQILDGLEQLAREERPDVALLVDAPDFNLRLAKRLKRLGIRVVFYVSPSVWAWRKGRLKTIARYVDEMCCILPFEVPWYRERGVLARFVGHPLLEHEPDAVSVQSLRAELLGSGEGPLLSLLPGSRRYEVDNLLPAMLGAARLLTERNPSLEVVLPLAPTIPRELVERHFSKAGFTPKVVDGRAREVLAGSDAAIVASGTATLEATLARVPMVVPYRASWLTALVFRLLVRARFISLPNILAGDEVVPELLQRAVTPEGLAARLEPLLGATPERARMVERLSAIRESLGAPGASTRVVEALSLPALPAPETAA